jgi:release factor glutamine methyltransferase
MTDSLAGQTVETARRALTAGFKSGGMDSAELDARMLVGAVLGLDLTGMITAAGRILSSGESLRLEDFARRAVSTVCPTRESVM